MSITYVMRTSTCTCMHMHMHTLEHKKARHGTCEFSAHARAPVNHLVEEGVVPELVLQEDHQVRLSLALARARCRAQPGAAQRRALAQVSTAHKTDRKKERKKRKKEKKEREKRKKEREKERKRQTYGGL
jgi:hypothetical protein